ncbi:MAG: ATP-binding cassette domain-containing protein [Bacillota bacterium]
MTRAIEATQLVLVKGNTRILDVDAFAVDRSEVVALVGPNGAGKSSLLQCLALLQKPSSGRVIVGGVAADRRNALSLRRKMAVVFQESLLLDGTVIDNVMSGLRLRGVPRSEAEDRAYMWMKRLGIDRLAGRPARLLSGGESQRASLARAFVLEPEVLFLDEPFTALDYPTRLALLWDMRELLRSTAVTAVFVTHDPTEIPYLTDKVYAMLQGRIIRSGSVEELFGHVPMTPKIQIPWEVRGGK